MKFLLCRCVLKIKTTYGVDIGVVKKKYLIYILNYAITSPIEWAIKNSIHSFDPGAGGKHKRRRGFFAKRTISLHKWFDKNMENIISPWLNEVNKQTEMEIDLENKSIPFK